MSSTSLPDIFSLTSVSIETVTSLGLYLIAGLFAIFSAILYYHWDAYSTDTTVGRLTLIVYFSTTIPLLIIMGIMTWLI